MSNLTIYNITELISKTAIENSDSEGITAGMLLVISKIFEVLTITGRDYGFWKFLIVLFAIIGFFAILSAIGNRIFSVLALLFKIIVIIPLIIITGLINSKKRKKRLTEWGEIKKDFKSNSKKIKKRYWVLWICLKIILPLLFLLLGIIIFF